MPVKKIKFGRFYQDKSNNQLPLDFSSVTTNSTYTPISWFVIAESPDRVLLLSEYILEANIFGKDEEQARWENSFVREWLNEAFYNLAFSEPEKEQILPTACRNAPNPIYGVDSGKDTVDKVFLLSSEEVERYIAHNYEITDQPTDYAQGHMRGGLEPGGWWLRTSGCHRKNACYSFHKYINTEKPNSVDYEGISISINYEASVDEYWRNMFMGIRPAIYVKASIISELTGKPIIQKTMAYSSFPSRTQYVTLQGIVVERNDSFHNVTPYSGTGIYKVKVQTDLHVFELEFRSKFQNAGSKHKKWVSNDIVWGKAFVQAHQMKEGNKVEITIPEKYMDSHYVLMSSDGNASYPFRVIE